MIERRRNPRTSSKNPSSSGPRWASAAVMRRTSPPPPITPAMPHTASVLGREPLLAAGVGGAALVEFPAVLVVGRAAAPAVDPVVGGDPGAVHLADGILGRPGLGRVV